MSYVLHAENNLAAMMLNAISVDHSHLRNWLRYKTNELAAQLRTLVFRVLCQCLRVNVMMLISPPPPPIMTDFDSLNVVVMTMVLSSNVSVYAAVFVASPVVSSKQSVHNNVQLSVEEEGKYDKELQYKWLREDHSEAPLPRLDYSLTAESILMALAPSHRAQVSLEVSLAWHCVRFPTLGQAEQAWAPPPQLSDLFATFLSLVLVVGFLSRWGVILAFGLWRICIFCVWDLLCAHSILPRSMRGRGVLAVDHKG